MVLYSFDRQKCNIAHACLWALKEARPLPHFLFMMPREEARAGNPIYIK